MDDILTTIFVNSLGVIFLSTVAYYFYNNFSKESGPVFCDLSPKRRKQYEKVFFCIFDGITRGTVNDKDDIDIIFRQSFKKSNIQYNDFLQRFQAWLLINEEIKVNPDINKAKSIITTILNEQLEREPYEGLSEDEISTFTSIEKLVANSTAKDAIKAQLVSISKSLLRTRERLKTDWLFNRFALAASVTSVIITLLIYAFGRTSISKEDIDTINKHTDDRIELAVDSLRSSIAPIIQENNQ